MTRAEIDAAIARLEADRAYGASLGGSTLTDALGIAITCIRDYVPREDRERGRQLTIQAEALRRAAYLHKCETTACDYCLNLKLEARDKETAAVTILKLEPQPWTAAQRARKRR